MRHQNRVYARSAGIVYLVTHVTSVTAVAAYAASSVALGVALEFILALGCLLTGLLLLPLLRPAGEVRAFTFAFLRTLEAAVIAAGTLPMLAFLWTDAAGTVAGESLEALHTAAFLVGQCLVISVNTIVLGRLLLESGLVPRALAVLGLMGGVLVLGSNAAQLFGLVPLNGAVAGACAVPLFAFELWFAFHLIIAGLRPRTDPSTAAVPDAIRPRDESTTHRRARLRAST
ncbi:DUF4386 domain-containing protein [Microbacterium sp. No. 7]|jgi:Domain of unknown function (DUF4386)|uniref:DUF4386 domain-containing protein n=1 Tax=Microbacterium sp. No. 7 TaxID=1714373 RepID=UPI0009E9A363|nr:DUF4386 domain-containing protein [Microbacterium sp. No. 7]